jgi:hypothetical protein
MHTVESTSGLNTDDDEDAAWQLAAYEQFLRDDASEDSVYDSYA